MLFRSVSAAEKVKAAGDDGAPAPAPKPKRGRGGKAAASRATARKPANEEWSWMDQVPATLALLAKVLRLKTQRIWQTTGERDTFIK